MIVLLSTSSASRTVPGVLAIAEGLGQRHVSQRVLRPQHGRHGKWCQGGSMGWKEDRPQGGMVGTWFGKSDEKCLVFHGSGSDAKP